MEDTGLIGTLLAQLAGIATGVVSFITQHWAVILGTVTFLAAIAAIATTVVSFVRWLRRKSPPISPFDVPRKQEDWLPWLRDQVADAEVAWIFPGQVPTYEARGFRIERKRSSGALIRTRELAPADIRTHGYAVLMTRRQG